MKGENVLSSCSLLILDVQVSSYVHSTILPTELQQAYFSFTSQIVNAVADPDFELRRGPVLFYLPCRLFFFQTFLLYSPKTGGEGGGGGAPLDPLEL